MVAMIISVVILIGVCVFVSYGIQTSDRKILIEKAQREREYIWYTFTG